MEIYLPNSAESPRRGGRLCYDIVDQSGILKTIGPGTGGPQPCKTITNRWWTDYCSATNDIYNNPTSGNVGIGLVTPYEKLHVLGDAVFTGSTTFGITGAPKIHGHTGNSSVSAPVIPGQVILCRFCF